MLVRILITLVVIALAVIYLRRRHQQRQAAIPRSNLPARSTDSSQVEQFLNQARQHQHPSPHSNSIFSAKLTVCAAVLIALVSGAAYSVWYWQDQQRLVTVLLHRSAQQAPVIYRVQKKHLQDGRFTTNDGTLVTVSANERMEVVGL